MSALKLGIALLLGTALAHGSVAQATAAPSTIVVEGHRLHSKVDDFVGRLTTDVKGDQLGRFLEDVCPGVVGLSDNLAQDITARIRRVADAVGADVAKRKCQPNLVLLVVHDKQNAIKQLRAGLPGVFAGMRVADIHRLLETPGPIAAWQLSSRIGADGMPLMMVRLSPTDGSNDAVQVVRAGGFISGVHGVMSVMRQFDLSLVIVEAGALDQVDTRQLADYTVMRGLAATGSQAVNLPAPSILQLFNPGVSPLAAPESVTWWDYAFLKSLYRSSNRREASAQRSTIRQMMTSELKKIPVEQR